MLVARPLRGMGSCHLHSCLSFFRSAFCFQFLDRSYRMNRIQKNRSWLYVIVFAVGAWLLILSGCVPPYLGAVLRFSGENPVRTAEQLLVIGSDQTFRREVVTEDMLKWGFLFAMTKKIGRREIRYAARMEGDHISVSVGRFGGIGNQLRKEEIAAIRSITYKLRADKNFMCVEREDGLNICE
jgi:hypothetical protein